MAAGRAETFDQRAEILGSIITRNRIVAALRIIVPAVGALAFVALAGQIYLANIARQYGVAGIRVDRGNIVVETPQYSGTSSSGGRYVVSAREARSPLNRSHEITMTDVTLELMQPSGTSYFARAQEALLDTGTEIVTVPGILTLTGSDGLDGTLTDVVRDTAADTIVSNGLVDLLLSDGTTIVAETMLHEGEKRLWTFTGATVTMKDLPGAEE